jgi:hypothetical protein
MRIRPLVFAYLRLEGMYHYLVELAARRGGDPKKILTYSSDATDKKQV